MYNEGISLEGDILDIGTELEVIEKRGAFYRYNDELIGQGRENSKTYLRENPKVAAEIEAVIRETYGLTNVEVPPDDPDDEEEE